jgi:uncharacterized membrane-anchored protein YitT (DUF2179 family)
METENNQMIADVDPTVDETVVVDNPENIQEIEADNCPNENKKRKINIKGNDVKQFAKLFGILCILSFIRALSMHVFVFPNGFAPGGLTGIASIIYNAILPSNPELAHTWFTPAIVSFVLNIPLFIASFFMLNKRFCINTIITVGLVSLWLWLLEVVKCPVFKAENPESAYNILAAATGGVGTGISLGFLLKHNSSMGGTDIIGKLIYKKNPVAEVQWMIIGCDIVIVLASGILGAFNVDDWHNSQQVLTSILSPILYSAISLIVCAEVADIIQSGFKSSIVFNVISDKHNEIALAISEKLHRGVTMVHAHGWYTGIEHNMLVCVVRKKQINQVNDIIKACDPEAFVYITKAKDVSGKGFTYHSAS